MIYTRTTLVPNAIFDIHLPSLSESELKVLLIVIRQTFGWKDSVTGGRKQRDRISGWQFRDKTGLSRRIVTKAIQSLSDRRLIEVSDFGGSPILFACGRKGKRFLYYRAIVPDISGPKSSAQRSHRPVHKGAHDKTNPTKGIRTPRHSGFTRIGVLMKQGAAAIPRTC